MGVADVYRLAIDDGQGMTEFVAQVALVTDVAHGPDEIPVVLIRIAPHHAVEHIKTTDRSVLAALEFAAEVRQDLQRADLSCHLVNGGRAAVGHERSVEADLQGWRVYLVDH